MSTTTPVPVEVTDVETPTLNRLTDRCDRCGAEAFVITQHGDSHLLWCAHHFTEHETELAEAKVLDERSRINKAASVSAY